MSRLDPTHKAEELRYVIVDGFYTDPFEVRNFAISCNFRTPLISSTPSLISDVRHPDTRETLCRIGALLGIVPDWETVDAVHNFWGQSACGEFQLSLRHLSTMGQVHSHKNGEWVGIVYLSSPSDCNGRVATFLVEHKRLGICHFSDVHDGDYELLKADSRDEDAWNILAAPDMAFNRLFLFDSRYFHAESPGFGDSAKTGRLVQIFNFKSMPSVVSTPTSSSLRLSELMSRSGGNHER